MFEDTKGARRYVKRIIVIYMPNEMSKTHTKNNYLLKRRDFTKNTLKTYINILIYF